MKISRIVAVLLVLAAALWIGSGLIGKADRKADAASIKAAAEAAPKLRFRVSVTLAKVEPHARSFVLSGRTEADKRASAVARALGTIIELRVRRGSVVKTGDVIAVLSDEARKAQVDQADARLTQRQAELRSRLRLIEQGAYPAINKPQLEADLRAAEAALDQAKAERDRGRVLAPISGIVSAVPVENGQAIQPGTVVAEMVALDPMLVVVELSERQLGGVRIGDRATARLITGQEAEGTVRLISPTASAQTRTYRVDIELRNANGAISDGVTCDVTLLAAPVPSARIARSALTFTSEGRLAVRTVDGDGRVVSVPVSIVEDTLDQAWLAGLAEGASVIVQGQDFVKDGELVEPVAAVAARS